MDLKRMMKIVSIVYFQTTYGAFLKHSQSAIGHVSSFLGQDEVAVLTIPQFLAIWIHCISACESDLTIVIAYSPLDIVGGSDV